MISIENYILLTILSPLLVCILTPFLSNNATVDSGLNSINSILTYDNKKEFEPIIIDAVGEWEQKKTERIKIKRLYKKSFYQLLPKGNYFKSRISQSIIFFMSFIRLKRLISEETPNYFMAHLIVSLPLLLFTIFIQFLKSFLV